MPWASWQIRKITRCACAGNAGSVFLATAGQRSRHASQHVRDARAVMHAGIANYRFSVAGKNYPGIPGACATRNFAYLVRGPWCVIGQITWSQMSDVESRDWPLLTSMDVSLALMSNEQRCDHGSQDWYHIDMLGLTHWGRDKMAAFSQTISSNAFPWMKMYEFRLIFHWSLFLGVQLTIFRHWLRKSHYLNQWWLIYWRIHASLGLNKLTHGPLEGEVIFLTLNMRKPN